MHKINSNPVPQVGDIVTQGMAHYKVISHDGGVFYTLKSWTGITFQITWHDSGYISPDHDWKIVPGNPNADSPLYR